MHTWTTLPFFRFGLIPFLGGLLYASGFPNKADFAFFLGPFLGMGILLNMLLPQRRHDSSFQQRMIGVLCFSLGHYLLGFYWIPYTIEVFGDVPFPFNHGLGLFFSLVVLPQFLLFLLLSFITDFFNLSYPRWMMSIERRHLFLALAITLLEYFTPQQFPGHLGHPWLSLAPYIGMAPYLGVAGFSFFSYLFLLTILSWWRKREKDLFSMGIVAIFILLNLIFKLPAPAQEGEALHVRMVQPNIGNYLKLSSESGDAQSLNQVLDQFLQMSTEPSNSPLHLIIWPETAYPRLLFSEMMKTSSLYSPRLVQDSLKGGQAELFFGGYDQVISDQDTSGFFETEYNSAFHISNDGRLKQVYHKRVLVPFGESLPFGPLNKYLSQYIQNISFFAKGESFTLFQTSTFHSFISLICYEVLFTSFVRDYLNAVERQPYFIVNLTNDSWYGDTAEPYQHLFLAKWRSLEFGLPILRMTNTGITSVLYPDGSESDRLLPFTTGNLDVSLIMEERNATLYQRFGILSIISLSAVFLLFSLGLGWFRKTFFNKIVQS